MDNKWIRPLFAFFLATGISLALYASVKYPFGGVSFAVVDYYFDYKHKMCFVGQGGKLFDTLPQNRCLQLQKDFPYKSMPKQRDIEPPKPPKGETL